MRAGICRVGAVILGAVLSCDPIQPLGGSTAPNNACPANPCSAYTPATGGPQPLCNGGVCLVTPQESGLVLVVSVPTDSYFAPGRTFAVRFTDLNPSPPPNCLAPECVSLPGWGAPTGIYLVSPDVALKVNWYLGNSGKLTALPVQATYRPLWGQSDPNAPYASSLGLPLDPVQGDTVVNDPLNGFFPPGPLAGPSTAFRVYLQPMKYERTLQPQPPFDAAFPPQVQVVTVSVGRTPLESVPLALDVAAGTEANPQSPPRFDITRTDGLDGWTAYLRDTTTGRILSNVRSLSQTLSTGVLLATSHVQKGVDALTNAELVVKPPVGTPIPTGVFRPVVPVSGSVPTLPAQVTYPPLPAAAIVSGQIATLADAPVAADLTFEALGIRKCQDAGCTGTGQLNTANFEFFASASARIDPKTGASPYSVVLPPGEYQVVVRPLDATSAVTTESFVVDAQANPLTGHDIHVYDRQGVQGSAVVADGRALSGATVEAIAVTCFGASGSSTSGSCLPPGGQTITLVDGSFTMNLDPGGYLLRVRPAEGTRLPWVTSALQVYLVPVVVAPVRIPAPMNASHELVDTAGIPIARAVVRVFSLPQPGAGATPGAAPPEPLAAQAVELGRAITDVSGHYEMYLAPPGP